MSKFNIGDWVIENQERLQNSRIEYTGAILQVEEFYRSSYFLNSLWPGTALYEDFYDLYIPEVVTSYLELFE